MKKLWMNSTALVKCCSIFLLLFLLASLFAGFLTPYDPEKTDLLAKNTPPMFMEGGTPEHILGTDELGRDLFARILYGTRISFGMAAFGMLAGSFFGTVLGLSAGYFGGAWDRLVQLLINFQQSVPYTLIVLIGVVIFGRGIPTLMIFIGMARWETYAKMIRGQVLSLKKKQYVEAAKCYNASTLRILTKYILPGLSTSLIVLLTLNFPSVLLIESSLSFIGIGVQQPTATLGQIVGTGRNLLTIAPWISLFAAAAIVVISYCLQQIGEYLREHFDIRVTNE